ncbi:MAG: 2Fe-2S iron-sulfur cluster-binding protein [Ilumatobacteraceae bacterium]
MILRAPEAETIAVQAADFEAGTIDPEAIPAFAAAAAAAAPPDRRSPVDRRLPPASDRGALPTPAHPCLPRTDARSLLMSDTTAAVPTTGSNQMYVLHVNGVDHEIRDAWLGRASSTCCASAWASWGPKGACEQGECGSCSVLVDDELVCGCLVLAASATGQRIVTIEGVAPVGAPSDVQQAFVDAGAVQCGFCTPGLIVATHCAARPIARTHRVRDPRGTLGQRLPLHRVRPDHRGRPACGRGPRGGAA